MSAASGPTGLILIDHGSRLPEAHKHLADLANELRKRHPGRSIAIAHLEVAAPSLRQSITKLVDDGVMRIDVFPLFLTPGNHLSRDLPALVREAARSFPDVELRLLPALGTLPGLVDLVSEALG